MLTIFRLTLREVFNQKIFLIASILSIVFLLLFGALLNYTVKGINSMPSYNLTKAMIYPQLFSLGLYLASFLINLFAIFISVGTISSEIESGIMQSVVPRPVNRYEILLGKYLGYFVTILVFSCFIFGMLLFLLRFECSYVPENPALGIGLFVLQPLILLTLTTWGSTFLSTIANGLAVIMLYVLATAGGMAENIGGIIKNEALVNIGIVSSLLMPTDAAYRKMVSVMLVTSNSPLNTLAFSPFGTSNPPSSFMVVYTFIYILFFLGLAMYIFAKRDI